LKKTRAAIALAYNPAKHPAPLVLAKGQGLIAEKIIQIAQEHNIPLQDDPKLLALLSQVEINDTIPEELFVAVAQLLMWVDEIRMQLE
jgi:FlhB-like protein